LKRLCFGQTGERFNPCPGFTEFFGSKWSEKGGRGRQLDVS